jgi:carboxyl-terminal processing protease
LENQESINLISDRQSEILMHYWTSPGRERQTQTSSRIKKSRFRLAPAPTLARQQVSPRSSSLRPILAFATVLVVFGGGVLVGRSQNLISRTPPDDLKGTFEPFWQTWNLVEKHYVGRTSTNRQQLTQGAIKGLLDSLGDLEHTHFQSKEEFEHYVKFMNGEAHGIGVRLKISNRQPRVIETLPSSPARAAGIQVGDVLTEIDGTDCTGLTLGRIHALIRGGSPDSTVHLRLRRAGQENLVDLRVHRAKENLSPVVWQMIPGKPVMHLSIRHFDKKTHSMVRTALHDAQLQHAKGMILDLRNCPGGLVNEALAVTSEFLKDGCIVIERDGEGKETPILVRPGGTATEIPVCVLVNDRTCSCAEVLAAALQDRGRGPVIGMRTAGMGTLLHPFEMSDRSVVFLAIAEWLTPSGKRLWHQGVTPNAEVQLPDDVDALLPGAEKYLHPETFVKLEDRQLRKALAIFGEQEERVAQNGKSSAIFD